MKLRTLGMSIVAACSLLALPTSAIAAGASTTLSCTTAMVTIPASASTTNVSTCTGTAADGSQEKIEIPANFNGNLILYSHGYVFDGSSNPATDAFSTQVEDYLLVQGDALAGSSYATTGWGAVKAALGDQIATLNDATALITANSASTLGQTLANTTITNKIATGVSLGGMITAALVQANPSTFTGAMPVCGVVGGGVPVWNQALLAEVAFKQFFDPTNKLLATGIPLASSKTNYLTADGLLGSAYTSAATSPATAARLALVAALGNVPTWFSPTGKTPTGELPIQAALSQPNITTSAGLSSALLGQMDWLFYVDFPYAFGPGRADLEAVAGGNPSWTAGVNFAEVLSQSTDFAEVKALYAAAGISLSSDLSKLQSMTPITASASALRYLESYFTYDGHISIPVLTMHTTNDGLVSPQNETLYANAVDAAGNAGLLRQVYVDQPGHCAFTASEYIAGLGALMSRIQTGSWAGANPSSLNTSAAANTTLTSPTYNLTADTAGNVYSMPPSFDTFGYTPGRFLAPYANGYQLVASDGGVFNYNSEFFGSLGNVTLNAPVVGGARTTDGKGYWLVAKDGGVFTFGDAVFYGSMGNKTLNAPIVGMAATPDDGGYWLVASDGGVFSFGDASFYGSLGNKTLNAPVVGMAATSDGMGYWLVAKDGGVFTFGDAGFFGSMGNKTLNAPVVGMAATSDGMGYWLVGSDGGVFTFGDGAFLGSEGGVKLNAPVVGISYYAPTNGYTLFASDGGVFNFHSTFNGSAGNITLNKPIVAGL